MAVEWVVPLVVFYGYVLLRIESHLLYHLDQAVFLLTREFFTSSVGRPGGGVDYLSAFVSAVLSINWLGSAILTLLVSLIVLATRQLLVSIGGADVRWLPLVPAFLILLLLGQYVHVAELCVGLVAVLWLARVYLLVGNQSEGVRLIAFVGLSALAYCLASGLYVVFACVCGVYELSVKRSVPLGVLGLLAGGMVPLAGVRWFDLSSIDAWGGVLSSTRHWLAAPYASPLALGIRISLLLFFPVAVGFLAWRHRTASRTSDRPKAKGGQALPDRVVLTGRRALLERATPLLVFVASLIVADFVLLDDTTKCLLRMVCCSESNRWEDTLACYERVPLSDLRNQDLRAMYHVNRALYFTGDLPNRMFAYPQASNGRALTLTRENTTLMAQSTPRQCSEILFDLGRINESEHMASEALEIFGNWPSILERLVRINVLKGRPEAARRYVSLMECSLLHATWAREMSRQLDEDPTLSDDPSVASRRDIMLQQDSIGNATDIEGMLQELLEANPRNQMAFEYLMAYYLLTRQLDKVIANLHRLDDFDYREFPRYYEEALALELETSETKEVDSGRWRVRQGAWRRLAAFSEVLQRFPKERAPEAYQALRDEFGDSYYLFFVFGANR